MDNDIKHLKLVLTLLFVAGFTLCGCSGRENITESSFVGKWKSSKSEAPVYLYANGEWEIKPDDGAVLEYGIWKYEGNYITWTFIQSDKQVLQVLHDANPVLYAAPTDIQSKKQILHDVNPVISVTPREFRVQENDRTITTFKKLD